MNAAVMLIQQIDSCLLHRLSLTAVILCFHLKQYGLHCCSAIVNLPHFPERDFTGRVSSVVKIQGSSSSTTSFTRPPQQRAELNMNHLSQIQKVNMRRSSSDVLFFVFMQQAVTQNPFQILTHSHFLSSCTLLTERRGCPAE